MARELLVARSDPQVETPPALVFLTDLRLPRSERQAPEIDVTVRAKPTLFGGCNPVHVHVEVHTEKLSRYGRLTAERVNGFALGVLSPGTVRNITTPREHVEAVARIDDRAALRSALIPGRPRVYIAAGRILAWPPPPYFSPLLFDFDADWAVARSAGSCFVQLPALIESRATAGFASDVGAAVRFREQRTLASRSALSGSTTLIERGSTVSRQPGDTLPAPDDPQLARWRCGVDHRRTQVRPGPIGDFDPIQVFARRDRTCGAQAVLTRSTIQEWGVFIAFMLAVFASLGLQMVYDGFFPRRRHASSS
jgi:hypothetical protein